MPVNGSPVCLSVFVSRSPDSVCAPSCPRPPPPPGRNTPSPRSAKSKQIVELGDTYCPCCVNYTILSSHSEVALTKIVQLKSQII